MYKKILPVIVLTVLFLVGCSAAYSSFSYSKNEQVAKFQVSKDMKHEYKIQNAKYKDKLERCVTDAYTVEAKALGSNLMIEHIGLDFDCEWHGMPRSMFTGFVKDKINSRTMELLDRVDVNEYEFSRYKTDKNCVLYLITISQMRDTTFIVDKTGAFYKDLLSKLKPDYKVKTIESACTVDYKSSLMDDTRLSNRYFGRSSGRFKN